MSSETVAQVRSFNRFYTRVIGALDAGLTGSPHTLTEARVLFEIAAADTVEVADLRSDLGLDAGYLSRILTRFHVDGLVSREPSAVDARRQVVRLTTTGRAAFAELDASAVAATEQLVGPLSDGARARLTDAMATIRAALDGAPVARQGYVLRAPEPGDLGWVVSRHGALYSAEYGWECSFETLVARIIGEFDASRDAAWIAERDGERAGCVFCCHEDDTTARLRMLLVEPSARGTGIGRRLVEQCVRHARRAGYERITLWTNDVLVAARRLYIDAGFTLDLVEPHRSFGRALVGQHWSRAL